MHTSILLLLLLLFFRNVILLFFILPYSSPLLLTSRLLLLPLSFVLHCSSALLFTSSLSFPFFHTFITGLSFYPIRVQSQISVLQNWFHTFIPGLSCFILLKSNICPSELVSLWQIRIVLLSTECALFHF